MEKNAFLQKPMIYLLLHILLENNFYVYAKTKPNE